MSTTWRHAVSTLVVCALIVLPAAGRARISAAQARIALVGSVVDDALRPIAGARVSLERTGAPTLTRETDANGAFRFDAVEPGPYHLRAERAGFTSLRREITIRPAPDTQRLPLVLRSTTPSESRPVGPGASGGVAGGVVGGVVGGLPPPPPTASPTQPPTPTKLAGGAAGAGGGRGGGAGRTSTISGLPGGAPFNTASYAHIESNTFKLSSDEPLSTFAADVDTASYTNVRRFLTKGELPPPDAVRVEELINYFRFPYPDPPATRPVSVTTEVGDCPWASSHKLVLVGLRAKPIDQREVAPRNIVLLVDVSGSMAPPERLPLVKLGLRMFVDTLREDDTISMVVYAGASGLALPPTSGRQRQRIHDAIEALNAGGSTNGAEGLILAYRTAREAYIPGGLNRVILATDGDFNVGVTSQGDLVRLIEREKASGVFLSVLGVGTDNLKDSTMEMLADKGNGHYAYLDSLQEARRVLVREGGATLETVAKDVKFQVEFNPAAVSAWKLIGYEDRLLAHEAFNDDTKDGGELGAGHTVTALYEIVPAGTELPAEVTGRGGQPPTDPLKYQTNRQPSSAASAGELLTVKVRYKLPSASESQLLTQPVRAGGASDDVGFAAAVAEFGLLLRDARASGDRWDALVRRLKTMTSPPDRAAERQSFGELVELAAGLRKLRAP